MRAHVAIAAGLVACCAALAACKNNASHIYVGRLYEPARGCLEAPASVDVVDGTDPGSGCAAKCLVAPADQDGGRAIYASTMCPPYPPQYETGGAYPGCDGAFAAMARGDTCLADGGSTVPAPDASSDAAPE